MNECIANDKNIRDFKLHDKSELDPNTKLDPYVFRYVVPFYFKSKFDDAFKCVDEDINWKRKDNKDNKTEIDLFNHLKDEYYFEGGAEADKAKQGCEWKLENCEKSLIFQDYIKLENVVGENPVDANDENAKDSTLHYSLEFKIADGGLHLFRNKIGFLWYELKPDFDTINYNTVDRRGINKTGVMLEFQHKIKELNRLTYFLTLEKDTNNIFLFGKWINTLLEPLDKLNPEPKDDIKKHNIVYFAQRKTDANVSYFVKDLSKDKIVPENNFEFEPDKALLFCYACFKEEDVSYEDQKLFAFRMANGVDNLKLSEQGSYTAEKPFDDTIWYASQEGVSIVTWSNSKFNYLEGKKADRVRYVYFKLFIKAIYQSYSLSVFSNRIHKDIPIINKDDMDEKTGDKIFSLYWDVNNFLAKSASTSVSYIDNHTLFFVYLKKQLRIVEDINSITAGLEAINNLQKEILQERIKEEAKIKEVEAKKRSEKTSALMGLLTLFNLGPGLAGIQLFFKVLANPFGINESVPNFVGSIVWFIITCIVVFVTCKTLFEAKIISSLFKASKSNEKNRG